MTEEIEIRFEGVPNEVVEFVDRIKGEVFPDLANAQVLTLFDLKKRTDKGAIVFGRIGKTNDLTKLLTMDEDRPDGYNYVLYLDKAVWTRIGEVDRARIVRHEFRHCYLDLEAKDPYKITGHEIEDFHAEVRLNEDDPLWKHRLFGLATVAYAAGNKADPPPAENPDQMEIHFEAGEAGDESAETTVEAPALRRAADRWGISGERRTDEDEEQDAADAD
jgi:hypothetical protein